MRSIPILLITLDLLPLSASLKCHQGMSIAMHGQIIQHSQEQECPAHSQVCVWMDGDRELSLDFVRVSGWSCGDENTKAEDCYGYHQDPCNYSDREFEFGKEGNITVNIAECCCVGDLCNAKGDAPKPPGPAPPPSGTRCYVGNALKIDDKLVESESKEEVCPNASTCISITATGRLEGENEMRTKMSWKCGPDGVRVQPNGAPCYPSPEKVFEFALPPKVCTCEGDLCNGQGDAPKPPAPMPPPSAPRCHVGRTLKVDGKLVESDTKEEACPGTSVCMWLTANRQFGGSWTKWECGPKYHTETSCRTVDQNYEERFIDFPDPATMCTCEGDLCNGKGKAPRPPGVEDPDDRAKASPITPGLSLAAAAAALLAACV